MLKNLSLLYVEDEHELTDLMKELLEDEVETLYIASNGEEGLKLFEEHHPDIVMSDIYMPKIDGLTMSQRIKERFPDTPVVLLTAFNNIEDMKHAIEIGIDRYINKPIKSQEQLEKPLNDIARRLSDQRALEHLSNQIGSLSKYAAIGQVVAHITHQWNQPLNIVSTKMSSMQVKHELGKLTDEDIRQCIIKTNEQIQFLSQTINDFRDFLRPKIQSTPFYLSDLFTKIDSLIGAAIRREKIVLLFSSPQIILKSVENKLAHTLINLINNGRDAIIHSNATKRYILIKANIENDHCKITVADSGGGIDESIMDTIFEPYFTTKTEEQGTGLGLYMAREFIVGHLGGTLKAANTTTQYEESSFYGASFEIILPLTMTSES